MIRSFFFRNWWVILIQGILLILLSLFIFNNPGIVLASLALWLGIIVLASGLYGVIAFFGTSTNDRDQITLFGSIAMAIIGFMMISKLIIGMIAINIAFGSLVSVVGLALLSGSWKGRQQFSTWWVIAIVGLAILVIGIKSIFDVRAGAQNISSLLGIAILLSGLGLVWLSFLKRRIVNTFREKWENRANR
jgi:uncharacterized membrane protein HdeD (DUF308 family)